ncbi:MAG: CAP domain-containing protein [Solirubrobacteraceae bacterium]|nr:hypothetical protein [Patulibacter sp.]
MRSRAITLAGAIGLAACAPTIAHAETASQMLGAINAQRASAGIPAVSTRSDWSAACGQHDAYMAGNRILTHAEDSANSLFTQTGSWAASHSILARDSTGFASAGNPWTSSPLHQFQALHPWLRTTGIDVTNGYACMVTLAGRDGGYTDDAKLVTYPGFGGTVPTSETARESPFVPGADVGLPEGTTTGPHLFIYPLGPQHYDKVDVRSASLTASDGSDVPLRWVDTTSARSGPYLAGGAILIPVSPLSEGQTYSLRVEVAASPADNSTTTVMSRTTSFTATAAASNGAGADTAQAASGSDGNSTRNEDRITTIGSNAGGTLSVALAWKGKGLKVRIHCASSTERCAGPLRVLVYRKGHRKQKLKFVARRGALKVNLAPGRTISRTVKMNKRQRASGEKRGFAIRWGGPAPVRAKALDYQ